MVPISKEFVFQSGYVSSKTRLCFLTNHADATKEETPNCQLFILREGKNWSQTVMTWEGVRLSGVLLPMPTVFVLGREGEVLVGDANGYRQESIFDGNASPMRRGPMRNMRAIAGSIYAVGMARQIYRRTGDKQWRTQEAGLPGSSVSLKVVGFNSINGSGDDDLYVVGWGGEIWHYSGLSWLQEESPTNLTLFDICLDSTGEAWVCGQSGIILRGRNKRWDLVEYEGEKPTFRSMTWFKNNLYLADGYGLYVLIGNKLSNVDFGVGAMVPSSHVHAGDDILLSVAGKEVFSTSDGINWNPLPI
jgi:hypothetical protein